MASSPATEQITYADLYARWERGNWRATEIDFTADREHWTERFDDHRRRAALFNYSLFFWGEDAVADNLSPYIDAAPLEEQKYFLTTQQVDEARHAVFFKRFVHEVCGLGDGTAAGGLEAIRPQLTWGFRKVFDRLDRMAEELRRDRSPEQFARAITLYHIVIEATLAQPGQHFIEDYLEREDLMPGFRSGIRNVALDEQRHIGFGVKVLSEMVADDPAFKDVISDQLAEVLPWTLSVLVPPNWDESYIETFGKTMPELGADGLISLESKLHTIGFTDEEVQRLLPTPIDMDPVERAKRSFALLRANYLGEKLGPPSTDHESMQLLFESMRLSLDHRHAPARPATIQWDFADAEPWHIRIDNGSTRADAGRTPDPDLTFSCRFEDWVDVVAGREDPVKLMLRRRLRPRGSVRLLMRFPKMTPSR